MLLLAPRSLPFALRSAGYQTNCHWLGAPHTFSVSHVSQFCQPWESFRAAGTCVVRALPPPVALFLHHKKEQ